jgi:mono/diheme cytochrome c family protein
MNTQNFVINKVLVASGLLALLVTASCAPVHKTGDPSLSSNTGLSQIIPVGASPTASVTAFSISLKPLLSTNCSACHGGSQVPKFAVNDSQLSHDTLVNSGLIDFANPSNSRIVQKIKGGHNNISTQVSLDMQNQIAVWVSAVTATPHPNPGNPPPSVPATPPGGGLPVPTPLSASFKSISEKLLIPKCVGCHGPSRAAAGIRYDTYARTLKTVTAKSTNQSKLYTESDSGSMPIGGIPRMTVKDVSVLAQWINAGAPNN